MEQAMADLPQPFSPVEPLHQVEQAVSLNQRVERHKEQANRRNPRRRRKSETTEETTEAKAETVDEAIATEGPSEGHIDYRA
jgi:hypothetical protein